MSLIKYIKEVNLSSERTINSFKTAIACLIGYAIVSWTKLPTGQWTLITIIVVMSTQTSFGGTIKKAYMRFLGTTGGALISGFTLYFFGYHLPIILVVITMSVILFTYIAGSPKDISNAGSLGATTIIITLFTDNPTVQTTVLRFVEIVLGIVISLVITKLIFPIHARNILRYNQANTLRNLRVLYQQTVSSARTAERTYEQYELDEKIITAISTQKKLMKESSVEFWSGTFQEKTFRKIIVCERNIFRTINFMYLCLTQAPKTNLMIYQTDQLPKFNQNIVNLLSIYADLLEEVDPQISHTTPETAKMICRKLEQAAHALSLREERSKLINVHSFLFGAQQLITTLTELGKLIDELKK